VTWKLERKGTAKEETMNELTMESLVRRVERENRRLKQAGVIALAVIAVVVLMGQATQGKVAKVIEAEKFVLRDADGKGRARLESLPSGLVRLVLLDKDENVQSVLGVGVGRPSLVLAGRNNKTILTTSFLSISGKSRLTLAVLPSGEQSLALTDNTGRTRAELAIEVDGSSTFGLFDRTGTARAVLGSTSLESETGVIEKRPESSLVLFGDDGKVIWKAP
jgi:hypothetical protein